jgi:hypothetical protein
MRVQDHYASVTITPFRQNGAQARTFYRITDDGREPSWWYEPGVYATLEDVVAAFSSTLEPRLQGVVLTKLANGEPISFSLEHAFDRL